MKILTVEYRRLRTFGNYENETVGAVAEVSEGQTPEDAVDELRTWVAMRLSDSGEISTLRGEINDLRWRKDQMERDIARTEDRWKAITAFLEKLGIERPADIPDDLSSLPF